jgi:hypothetical protein
MSLSIAERLMVPAAATGLFALMSWGFMMATQGATSRMRAVCTASIVFMAGFGYTVMWQDKLASISGWPDTWIAVVAIFAIACVFLCRRWIQAKGPPRRTGSGRDDDC